MKPIDSKLLKKLIALAGDRLTGRWVLLGGTMLPALGREHRVTTDIDLVSLDEATQSETVRLMEIAEQLGLPVESINQSALYFLRKQSGFEKHLIELHRGKSAVIYRPDSLLFIKLKVARLSDSDLSDCLELLRMDRNFDRNKAVRILENEISKATIEERRIRLQTLLNALNGGGTN